MFTNFLQLQNLSFRALQLREESLPPLMQYRFNRDPRFARDDTTTAMSFACIYVPDFPVEALLRTAPELREQIVAVLDGTPPMLTVIAANARARAAGIEIGMTKLQAEACP